MAHICFDNAKGKEMSVMADTKSTYPPIRDKTDRDRDHEQAAPGHDTGGTGGVGARPIDNHGGRAAKEIPLDTRTGVQAGSPRGKPNR